MELGGQNICSTTFAPHVWHLMGKLGVNLPHLPHLPHHPNRPLLCPACPASVSLSLARPAAWCIAVWLVTCTHRHRELLFGLFSSAHFLKQSNPIAWARLWNGRFHVSLEPGRKDVLARQEPGSKVKNMQPNYHSLHLTSLVHLGAGPLVFDPRQE
jgi:hypothetical protein